MAKKSVKSQLLVCYLTRTQNIKSILILNLLTDNISISFGCFLVLVFFSAKDLNPSGKCGNSDPCLWCVVK